MIKWSEFTEGDTLFEAFLPEHEAESHRWLLRASVRGHILAERSERLTWPPRFGPDAGDVAVVEALADALISELRGVTVPEGIGPYTPTPAELPPADPYFHAALFALLEACREAQASLGVSDVQMSGYLSLPVEAGLGGLFPFAISGERDARMHRLVALHRITTSRPNTAPYVPQFLDAVFAADLPALTRLLRAAGVEIPEDATTPDVGQEHNDGT